MLGKTHVVGSLAVAHAGFVLYTGYVTERFVKSEHDTATLSGRTIDLFGFRVDSPLSITAYSLILVTVLTFVLFLLRIGKPKCIYGYLFVMAGCLFCLMTMFPSTYPVELAFILLSFTLGSLLPDIDSEKSTIGRYVRPISGIIPHRTITHTIWVVLFILALGFYFKSVIVLALGVGYVLHIIEDAFSRQGICWFYPVVGEYVSYKSGATIKKGRKAILAYRTGGTGETMLFYTAIVIHVLCTFAFFWMSAA